MCESFKFEKKDLKFEQFYTVHFSLSYQYRFGLKTKGYDKN